MSPLSPGAPPASGPVIAGTAEAAESQRWTRRLLWRAVGPPARLFDAIERGWERPRTQHALGVGLVVAFLAALVVVELARRGWLPGDTAARLPHSHFWAVDVAFTLLLVLELVALVLALARSVAESVAKQFELLALILLRKAILEVAHVGEPIAWRGAAAHVPVALADMAGALAVFALAEVHAHVQRHRAIANGDDQAAFIAAKKVVALGLLAALCMGAVDAAAMLSGAEQPTFFEVCFTVLIFSDVLLVLLSLAASADYRVVFRNSGYAAATVMIRLALTAPPYLNVGIAVAAAAYAVLVSVAYERARAAPLVGVVALEPRAGV
ncbi:MAG TPA: hypothetical protein VGD56_21035 [Gemmatirosa sp.]